MPMVNERAVVEATVRWLERAVIGLNLCPFAKAVHLKQRIRYVVSDATEEAVLIEILTRELEALVQAESGTIETTLLICPLLFKHFLDFNAFLARADDRIHALGLDGVVQVPGFHPAYQFAGEPADDISHCTNRSPYPTLHLLREDSVSRAVEVFPNPAAIYESNMVTLRRLGWAGWHALGVDAVGETES